MKKKAPAPPSDDSGIRHGQTNRETGNEVILGLQGKAYGLIPLDEGGSPNQKFEEAVGWIIQCGLVAKDMPKADLGLKRVLELLAGPFMSIEPATDSHAAIYLRAACGARIAAAQLRSHPEYAALELKVLDWFEHYFALHTLGLVPRGPLQGKCVLPCARKTPGAPSSGIRNAWLQLVGSGRVTEKGVGKQALDLDVTRPDNAGLALTKQILTDPKIGGFGPNFKRGTLPELIAPLVITRYADGHEGRFPDGIPGQGDLAPYLWVQYSTGVCKWDGTPRPDLGAKVMGVTVPAMRAAA